MRVINIGKNIQPVNLSGMASVSSLSWEKSASFCTLHETIYSLADFYSVADVISLVSNDLSLDTGATFQEAQSLAKSVIENSLSITNLEPLAFLLLAVNWLRLMVYQIKKVDLRVSHCSVFNVFLMVCPSTSVL